MDAKSLVEELGINFGIELELGDESFCSLEFDHDEIGFEFGEESFYLTADVGIPLRAELFYEKALVANLKANETAGGYFAIEDIYGTLILMKRLPTDMEYTDFENELGQYLKTLRRWKKKLRKDSDRLFEKTPRHEPRTVDTLLAV